MIDLHTHTSYSDGALIPAEMARRAEALGVTAIGFSDHVDASNVEFVAERLKRAADALNPYTRIQVLPGVELTHVPPGAVSELAEKARAAGAAYVVVHGETIVEPVAEGTNQAAIAAGVDILAHPGLLTEEDAALAAARGVFLEISARKGHSLTNGRVARLAEKTGARLLLNTDAHAPSDLINLAFARRVASGAGLTDDQFEAMRENARSLVARFKTPAS